MKPLRLSGSQPFTQQPGVYIVMHNQVFPVDRARKDRELARFVWK